MILVLLVDFLTKQLVIHSLVENQSVSLIQNFFSLTYVKNTGIAFSFLEGKLTFIIGMSFLVLFFLFFYLKKKKSNWIEVLCYGMLIGGAIGNLVDRIVYGYVIDFFDFTLFRYQFPIFNVADMCIVIGIFGLLFVSFFENKIGDNII